MLPAPVGRSWSHSARNAISARANGIMVTPAGWFSDVISDAKDIAMDAPISCYPVMTGAAPPPRRVSSTSRLRGGNC